MVRFPAVGALCGGGFLSLKEPNAVLSRVELAAHTTPDGVNASYIEVVVAL